jgi:hypothetical protein
MPEGGRPMIVNTGVIEHYIAGANEIGGVRVRIFYDPAGTDWPNQPLRDVDGFCLVAENTTGHPATVRVSLRVGAEDVTRVVTIPTSGVRMTAAEMAAWGFTKRGDVGLSLSRSR